jgi:hypothetical protein
LADASRVDLAFDSRFDLAYDAAHALALYALRRLGCRGTSRRHRVSQRAFVGEICCVVI